MWHLHDETYHFIHNFEYLILVLFFNASSVLNEIGISFWYTSEFSFVLNGVTFAVKPLSRIM